MLTLTSTTGHRRTLPPNLRFGRVRYNSQLEFFTLGLLNPGLRRVGLCLASLVFAFAELSRDDHEGDNVGNRGQAQHRDENGVLNGAMVYVRDAGEACAFDTPA